MNKNWLKIFILILAVFAFAAYFIFDLGEYFSLAYLQQAQSKFATFYAENPLICLGIFFAIYVVSTALSIPGAALLTLLAGALFGLLVGTVLVSFASTIGATLAFLASRFVLRDTIQAKFGKQLEKINRGVEKDGAFYLFTMRLLPAFPFFVINLVMGLTKMRAWTFAWVSQVGMLAGTIVYVNAGTQLAQIESTSDILSPTLIGSFVLLGIFPFIARAIVRGVQKRAAFKGFTKPKQFDYNVIVIGGGSAGLVTSLISATLNAKVALIERENMGGDCLYTGCVPSKSLLRSAKLAADMRNADKYGIAPSEPKVDFKAVIQRVQKIIETIEPHDSPERYESLGVNCIAGEATLISPWEVRVEDKTISARNIVLATGGRPAIPPIPGLKESNPYTSDTIWKLQELPQRLVIIGGGPIGCEMAQAFSRLGSDVSLVERGDRIMKVEDPDAAAVVTEALKADGVAVLTNASVDAVRSEDAQHIVCYSINGEQKEIGADVILVAAGRTANSRGFGLEEIGVKLNDNGTVWVDEFLATSMPNIYACGDLIAPYQFTHSASHEAWYCAVNSLFEPLKRFRADYSVLPWTTFTDPEVARVGLNEAEAKEAGTEYEVTKYDFAQSDRALAEGATEGFVKVLTPPGKDSILGATIVGPAAGELITEFISAKKRGKGLKSILETIHVYPTLSEANKMVAGNWRKANKPEKVLQWLEKFHSWRR